MILSKGVVLDSCEHDVYICPTCKENGLSKDDCKNQNHEPPDCLECIAPGRYQLFRRDYIRKVLEELTEISDDYLFKEENFNSGQSPADEIRVFMGSSHKETSVHEPVVNLEDFWKNIHIFSECGTRAFDESNDTMISENMDD